MVSVRPPTEGDFALELEKVLQENREAGQAFVVITAGELHRRVGGSLDLTIACRRAAQSCGLVCVLVTMFWRHHPAGMAPR
jgi:hypothetical protein